MIRVRVEETRGSTPREAGAEMWVGPLGCEGSIGGGALEWDAMRTAREMLAAGQPRARRVIALGPALGQCCGGSVTLSFEAAEPESAARLPLWIWGAGHVGRAIAGVLAPLPHWAPVLVDVAADRFPVALPDGVAPLVAADPLRVVGRADKGADHLILTYSHDLDLALCDALLRHGFGSCGLIGSATKWARFRSRLSRMGHSEAQIARIACPIGDPAHGKHPQAIAVSVAAALLRSVAADARRGTGTA